MNKVASCLGLVLLAAMGGSLAALPVTAADTKRAAAAHLHGHGTLNIAVEGQHILMELQVPGSDVFGFEHAAESEAEKEAQKSALAALRQPQSLFAMPAAAGCELVSAEVAIQAEQDGKDADKPAAAETQGHRDEHDAGHNEVRGDYILRCDKPDAIDEIRFVYFDRFSGADELDVNVITDHGQHSFEVNRTRPMIVLQGKM